MKAAVMTDIGQMDIVERPKPAPAPDEVLVKIDYVGVCGSDLHYFETGRIGDYIVKPPFVLGHECSGVVVKCGGNVAHLKEGDRVALEPGKTCGKCEFCRKGYYNLCPNVIFFATPPVDGVFQQYVTHEAALCFKLPDTVDQIEGALIEPLAVGFHAANAGNAQPGKAAVVFGAGCIGLVSMLALIAEGVNTIYVVDIMQKRLDTALALGATGVINAQTQNVEKEIMILTNGRGMDIAIETAGSEFACQQAIKVTCKGANVVMVGYSKSGMINFPMSLAIDKELDIRTIFRYRHIYPMAIEAVANQRINIKGIVSHMFAFDKVQEAMDACVRDKADVVKAVIRIGG